MVANACCREAAKADKTSQNAAKLPHPYTFLIHEKNPFKKAATWKLLVKAQDRQSSPLTLCLQPATQLRVNLRVEGVKQICTRI